ncbi:MAG: N-6 DNA methylase [Candidatus Nitrosopolaris sp.]
MLSQFYEDLLVKLGKESGIAGEFYTPRPIVKLTVKMTNPVLDTSTRKSIRILDPFCGSCGFLVESYHHLLESKKATARDYIELQRDVFHGYEKKSLPYLVGLTNCILHGLLTPNVMRKNSPGENITNFGLDDKFDYVLTNPPFGGTEKKQIQQNFPVRAQPTELLALQQIMKRVKNNGKCGVVVPEGLLSRGDSFAKVKQDLLENYNVHTIISLPAGVFANVTASGQGPKTNLMFFDKTVPTKEIWYYELLPPNGKKYSKARSIRDDDLVDCFEKWKKRTVSENSWIVGVNDIVKRNYDMTARKPEQKMEFNYQDPIDIISETSKLDHEIQTDLEELKNMMKGLEWVKNGTGNKTG